MQLDVILAGNRIATGGTWNFVAATNQLATVKNANENTYGIFPTKSVTKAFLKVSRCSRAKQRQRNVEKSVQHVQSCFFAD